jgi:hypothetical protein
LSIWPFTSIRLLYDHSRLRLRRRGRFQFLRRRGQGGRARRGQDDARQCFTHTPHTHSGVSGADTDRINRPQFSKMQNERNEWRTRTPVFKLNFVELRRVSTSTGGYYLCIVPQGDITSPSSESPPHPASLPGNPEFVVTRHDTTHSQQVRPRPPARNRLAQTKPVTAGPVRYGRGRFKLSVHGLGLGHSSTTPGSPPCLTLL